MIETQSIFGQISSAEVDYRRTKGEVSEAHNEGHLKRVADSSVAVAKKYQWDKRTQDLVYISGSLHDIVRSSSEGSQENISDAQQSAYEVTNLLEELDRTKVYQTDDKERTAIGFGILHHSKYPEWLKNAETRNIEPTDLQDRVRLALFVGDKLDANGIRVAARRSAFVAGDRLKNEKGDWRQYGFQPNRDEALVVAIESALRLTFINPQDIYPDKLKPLVDPLYDQQRQFVLGLYKELGLNVEDIAQIMLQAKRGDGKNILEVGDNRVAKQQDLVQLINSKGKITNEGIADVSKDQATSSMEVVDYFSNRYTQDLDKTIVDWKPAGEYAKRWKNLM